MEPAFFRPKGVIFAIIAPIWLISAGNIPHPEHGHISAQLALLVGKNIAALFHGIPVTGQCTASLHHNNRFGKQAHAHNRPRR
jgi:hypothetical protein